MQAFETHTPEVYGWAYRLVGRHHDALDVVQDVFLKWRRQCQSDPPGHPRSWLRRVTINQAIDHLRRRGATAETAGSDGSCDDAVAARGDWAGLSGGDGRLDALDVEALRVDIAAALERLSDMQRAVLVAKVYDELSFAEIARELELAVPTVKTHFLRALQGVRRQLGGRWAEEKQR